MARKVRQPPTVSEKDNFRAREAFDNSVEDLLELVGSVVQTVGVIGPGASATVTVPVGVPPDADTVAVKVTLTVSPAMVRCWVLSAVTPKSAACAGATAVSAETAASAATATTAIRFLFMFLLGDWLMLSPIGVGYLNVTGMITSAFR
mgnify:CR=1 FL=1